MMIRLLLATLLWLSAGHAIAQEEPIYQDDVATKYTIFDDKMLLDGYSAKYLKESQDVLMAIIQDEGITSYKTAAAVRVLREQYGDELVGRERKIAIQHLWRKLNRTDSAFVQVEAMLTLLTLDRYRYFASLVPALIQKLDHYNRTVNENAYLGLQSVLESNGTRAREARIVFNVLRKMMFLSRNRLKTMVQPPKKLQYKLELLRWSIKVLGTEELKRLPDEVIGLL